MGLFVGALFVVGEQPALLFAAAGLVLVATLEEFILMWLLPEWTADVRGATCQRRSGSCSPRHVLRQPVAQDCFERAVTDH